MHEIEQLFIEAGCGDPGSAVMERIVNESINEAKFQLDINDDLLIIKWFHIAFTNLKGIAEAGQRGAIAGKALRNKINMIKEVI